MNVFVSPDPISGNKMMPVLAGGVEQQNRDSSGDAAILASAIELLLSLEGIEQLDVAAKVGAEQVQAFLGAQRVVVGWCPRAGAHCKLLADTDSDVSSDNEADRLAEFAIDELIVREEAAYLTSDTNVASGHAQLALQQFANEYKIERLCAAPLLNQQGSIEGAWLICNPRQQIESVPVDQIVDMLSRPFGARLSSVQKSSPGLLEKVARGTMNLVRQASSGVTIVVLLIILTATLFPIDYTVRCDCILRPTIRRFVAAPFDGTLDKAFVRPGDVVEADALLARMNAREIDWQLAGLYADLQKANRQRKVSLAKQDYAQSQIAELESRKLESDTRLLEQRANNLEIRSPIKGVVVSGDIKDVEGSPMKIGQTLFEIAPVGKMVVELLVPEDDFTYVKEGMPVSLRLDAFPTQVLQGNVQRINPRAEIREQNNVFIAEMEVSDPHAIFRPGMHGHGGVVSVKRPLFWVMFHRPWHSLLMWLGW